MPVACRSIRAIDGTRDDRIGLEITESDCRGRQIFTTFRPETEPTPSHTQCPSPEFFLMATTRKSTRSKAATGTLRLDRLHGGTVPALRRMPPAPATLSDSAKTAWRAFGKSAMNLGTLSAHDIALLELLARTWADCLALEAVLSADGLIVESRGARKAHPALQALAQARGLAHKLLGDFGLSPPGRERISIDPRSDSRRPWEYDPERDPERFFR